MVEKVFRTLPKKFDIVVITIEESKDLTQLSIDELLGSLLSHESRMNKYDDFLEKTLRSQVFLSRSKGGSRSRGKGRNNRSNNQRYSSEQERRPHLNPRSLRGSNNKIS